MKIFKILALLALFLFPAYNMTNADASLPPEAPRAVAPAKPKMFNFVKKLNPGLSEQDATYISKVLQEKATEYGLDLVTFTAVIAQESSFQLNLQVCHGAPGNCDRGLGQISSYWVKVWNLDPNRLRYDVTYNLDASARILSAVYKENPTEKKAYSRYYNPLPSFRKTYEKLVDHWILVASR
jgi:Transglycosylase SLT domain